MGLKTNKATKTSRLTCQYVGSFSVKDGDRKMPIAEQNKFVDEKLRNCTKKLLDGMPVFLEVSPDGIQVLASDEKTVKMAHQLRRVSYATVEPTNKIFAYVSHQPGSNMEVVCHTFITKKRDHAEGLSAALGKLFKQTFAYTLKRKHKLDEAAQNRGAGRRWAKQQVAEGHSVVVRNSPNVKTRPTDVNAARKENDTTPKPTQQLRLNRTTATGQVDVKPRRKSPPGMLNGSISTEVDDPRGSTSTAATVHQTPSKQVKPVRSSTLPTEWETPFVADDSFTSATATVHQPPSMQAQPVRSPTLPAAKWQTPFVPPSSGPPKSTQSTVPPTFTPSWPTEDQPPPLPSRQRPSFTRSQSSSHCGSVENDAPPELPRRGFPRRSSTPISPGEEIPPALPKRYTSDSSLGFGELGTSDVPPTTNRRDSGFERQSSAPPDLMPSSPMHSPVKSTHTFGLSGEISPTHCHVSWNMGNPAAVLLAGANETPPPLPRKERQGNEPPPEIEEEVIDPVEDEQLRRGVREEPRFSLTLEDEDWYIPGVSRDIVIEMLETSDIGTFFVRDSQSRPGCYALTMKVIKSENNPTGFGNYLITPEGDGFALQGFDKSFPDISTLIRHYASFDGGLPCRLVLAGSNPLFLDANDYLVEFMDEEDDRYASLASCTSMIQEFHMENPW